MKKLCTALLVACLVALATAPIPVAVGGAPTTAVPSAAAQSAAPAALPASAAATSSQISGVFDVYTWNIFGHMIGNQSDGRSLKGATRARVGLALARLIANQGVKAIIGVQEDWQGGYDCQGPHYTWKYVSGRPNNENNPLKDDPDLWAQYVTVPGRTRDLAGANGNCVLAAQNDGTNLFSSFPFSLETVRRPVASPDYEPGAPVLFQFLPVGWNGDRQETWHAVDYRGHEPYRETFEELEYGEDYWGSQLLGLRCTACKGFMWIPILIEGVEVDLYNVHTGPYLKEQVAQLVQRILEISGGPNDVGRRPIILVGDFNMHWIDYIDLLYDDPNYWESENDHGWVFRTEDECVDSSGSCREVYKYDPIEYRKKQLWKSTDQYSNIPVGNWPDHQFAFRMIRGVLGLHSACQAHGLPEPPDLHSVDPGHCVGDWWLPKSGAIDQIFYRDSEDLSLEVIDYEMLACWKDDDALCGRYLPPGDPVANGHISDHGLVRARLEWSKPYQPPVADANGPYFVDEGSTVVLDGRGSYDPDGDSLSYLWDPGTYLDDPDLATPTYSGVDDTEETVTLTVTDPWGLSDSDPATVTVDNVPPTINSLSAPDVDENSLATLTGAFTDPGLLDTHVVEVQWGDGSVESVDLPLGDRTFTMTHQYLDDDPTATPADTYTIVVTVTDDDGGGGSGTHEIMVRNVLPTVDAGEALWTFEDHVVALPPATFNDIGTMDTHTAMVEWGDGSPPEPGLVTPDLTTPAGAPTGRSGTVDLEHVYLDPGTYEVTVCVADDDAPGTPVCDQSPAIVLHGQFDFCASGDDLKIEGLATTDCPVRGDATVELKREATVGGDVVARSTDAKLGETAVVGGDVVSDGTIDLKKEALVEGSITSGHDVTLEAGSHVTGEVTAAGKVKMKDAIVDGTVQEYATVAPALEATPVTTDITATGEKVRVKKGETLSLAPGVYGDVSVEEGATLELSSGEYAFGSWTANKRATVRFDLSAGPATIEVVRDLHFHEGVQMLTRDGPEVLIVVQGKKVDLGKAGTYLGTFVAPDANLQVHDAATVLGTLHAGKVTLARDANLTEYRSVKLLAAYFLGLT